MVCSIMVRPNAVTLLEMGIQGSWPTVAPVKPYTELAEILMASWRPFCTARTLSSVAAAMSFFAFLRAANSSSKIWGRMPCNAQRNKKI